MYLRTEARGDLLAYPRTEGLDDIARIIKIHNGHTK